ncbi:MAG: hypothetical protein ACR2HR_09620 [Euzebya sp.]
MPEPRTPISTNVLFQRIDGLDAICDLVEGSDTEVLTRLESKPALLFLPGANPGPSRLISVLLHGNEDSGFRALCGWLRERPTVPGPLWMFIGNVRAATQNGWFADRYLNDQEDFNRVWGIAEATTRMRMCAKEVLEIVTGTPLEAAIDIHNNTGDNPLYAIIPEADVQTTGLAATLSDIGLLWGTQEHTLMQALEGICPAVAVECGLAGVPAHVKLARDVIEQFVSAGSFAEAGRPSRMLEIRYRVEVRPEVMFDFCSHLDEEIDFAITPGLDTANFGHLGAGTMLGRTLPGSASPLRVIDDAGAEVTAALIQVDPTGAVTLTRDVIPAMMTRTPEQTRRDCLFYVLADHR